MANVALVNYWVSLIRKESYKMEDVPDDIREIVQRKLNGEDDLLPVEETQSETFEDEEESSKLGAKALANKTYYIDGDDFVKSGKFTIGYLITAILDNDVLNQDEEYPKDINFSLVRIENFYGRFLDIPNVKVLYDADYCHLKVEMTSKPNVYFRSGDEIIRLDLRLTSSNYEDMTLTVYVVAK